MSGDVQVVGGAAGLAVQYAALARAAGQLSRTGAELLGLSAARHRVLADGDLLASAVLNPGGFARVEAALVQALDGPQGLSFAGARLEVRAGQLLLAVARYRAVDHLEGELDEARRWLEAAALLPLAPLAIVGAGAWAVTTVATGGDVAVELEQFLADHPGVVDRVVGVVPGLTAPLRAGLAGPLPLLGDQVFQAITGETLLPASVEDSAGLLALLYEPAGTTWTSRPDTAPDAVLVPGGVREVLERLAWRDRLAQGERGGDIGVTRIVTTGPDGRELVSWVVDVPGTKQWQFAPGAPRPSVNDLASNLELMAGIDNARVDALRRILEQSGAQPGEPVMLVGHSQGGMVAMRAAQELADRFTVTHVVTAGSPVAGMPVPRGVQVLSFENAGDVVPHLDGRANPDEPGRTTVLVDRQHGTLTGNHDMDDSYVPGAADLELALERSAADSVQAWLDSADDFLAGRGETHEVTTTVHTVTGTVPR